MWPIVSILAALGLIIFWRSTNQVRAAMLMTLGLGALGVAGITAKLSLNPLRHSDAEIREWVLQKTPLGSTRTEVMAVIAKEGWSGHSEFRGTPEPERFVSGGVTFYGADLGSYQGFPWRCRADAFWNFSADDKVIGVYVSSWCEGL